MAQADLLPPGRPRSAGRLRQRDEARARMRGPRRFHASGGNEPPTGGSGEGPIWPPPGQPIGITNRVEWPFWLVLAMPWLTLLAGIVLNKMQVCVMCLPANVPLPAI